MTYEQYQSLKNEFYERMKGLISNPDVYDNDLYQSYIPKEILNKGLYYNDIVILSNEVIGGVCGRNCWGNENEYVYFNDDEEKEEFLNIDDLNKVFNLNLNILIFSEYFYTSDDYYGNTKDHKVYVISLYELLQYIF